MPSDECQVNGFSVSRACLAALIILFSFNLAAGSEGPPDNSPTLHGDEIRVELIQAPAKFYVIGDAIPIEWRFTNTTDEPLGMLWEGCCFTYGEIIAETTAGERAPPKLPPRPPNAPPGWIPDPKAAQSWHAFPQITRIEPRKSVSFQTVLDNWVEIGKSGHYKLTASYTGAPDSALQRRSKIKLWNGKAEAKAVEFELLTPNEYLARKAAPDDLSLQVGAVKVDPIWKPVTSPYFISCRVHNGAKEAREVSYDLWILDEQGRRVIPDAIIPGITRFSPQRTTVAPEADADLRWKLESSDLLNLALEKPYLVFANCLCEGERFPSPHATFEWRIERQDVLRLLHNANDRGKIGARSDPYRVLRRYLFEIEPILKTLSVHSELDELKYSEKSLITDLLAGAALKRLLAGKNALNLTLMLDDAGNWSALPKEAAAIVSLTEPVSAHDAINFVGALKSAANEIGVLVSVELGAAKGAKIGGLQKMSLVKSTIGMDLKLRLESPDGKNVTLLRLRTNSNPNVLLSFETNRQVSFSVKIAGQTFKDARERMRYATVAEFRDAASQLDSANILLLADDNMLISDIDAAALEGFEASIRGP
jgi:hypothetical protein